MPITVNADDFGKDRQVNEAICAAFAKGLIHRTTLMANMPFAKEAMDLAREKGFADRVGIHLNLTAGKPLTKNIAKDREFCDENGFFTADFHRNTFKRFVLSNHARQEIKEELDAQLDRYIELGGTLLHVDSHHHVHTDMSVLIALLPLLDKYGVKSIRIGRNLYHGGNRLMRLYKRYLNHRLAAYNKVRSDYFGSADDFENFGADDDFVRSSNIEIMVHPLYDEAGRLLDTDYPIDELKDKLGGRI